jgi:uncharacterized membrane protein
MIFCKKCGAPMQEGVKFCPACGAQTEEAQQNQAADAAANKTMAILSYIIFFIPLITGDHKKSPFVKFHVNQGTVLAIAAVAWGIAENIVLAILRALLWNGYTWGIYGVFSTILNILWLAPTILCIYGIYNAATGKQKELPVIGKFRIIK